MNVSSIILQIRQDSTAGRIHRLARLLNEVNEHRWASDGFADVRSAHIQLLLNIDPDGTTNGLLAQRAGLTKQTMSRMVKDLLQNDYVAVSTNPADSRAIQISLTDRGKEFVAYLARAIGELNQSLEQIVGQEDFVTFRRVLDTILTFVDQRYTEINTGK